MLMNFRQGLVFINILSYLTNMLVEFTPRYIKGLTASCIKNMNNFYSDKLHEQDVSKFKGEINSKLPFTGRNLSLFTLGVFMQKSANYDRRLFDKANKGTKTI